LPPPLPATNNTARTNDVTGKISTMTNDQENPNQPQKPSTILGAVEFNNVSFAYLPRPNVNVL
jgi:ABC-type bacteriocin/lantibiotic exporter with double-glycine peptidase domain